MSKNNRHVILTVFVAALLVGVVQAAPIGQEAQEVKSAWFKEHLTDSKSSLPFSFTYNGQPSTRLLAEWPAKAADERLDANRTRRTLTWTDPKTGLEVKCIAVDYADYPAVEWTVWFKNTGKADTPILKDIQGLDAAFTRPAQGEFVLHGNKGDWNAAEGFEPYRRTLAPGTTQRFAPNGPVAAGWSDVALASGTTQRLTGNGGRPTNGPDGWPYYNVQWTGGGFILAIGWPGQWATSFSRDEKTSLRITAGQELTNLSLKPGEEVRSPLTAMLFWQGDDVVSAQNLWRRWYMAHNIPKIDGKPPAPITMMQLAPTLTGSEQEQFAEVKKYADAGIEIDLYWNDAGWYPCGGKWPNTGTWEIDASRYPNGFKPIADWVHAKGKKLVVWFEPERVGDQNSWLSKNHPEWLIGGDREPRNPEEARKWKELGRRLTHNAELVNLGNPEARQWVIERVDSIIKTNGIDYYRQDFNHPDPLGVWRRNDAPNRQGMTENLHVQGYLAFWDELRRRHPAMLIDTCASGGRRLDLETLRRSVPLLRSDFQSRPGVTEGNQGHTYGLSSWLPFQGSSVLAHDAYTYRSFYLPSFGMGELTPKSAAAVQKAYGECRRIAPLMLFGDYYPLTPYSLKLDQWIGWQFNRPEQGDGVVQAFRREQCEAAAQTYRLRGLDPTATYEVTNFDVEGSTKVSGKDLMDKGLPVKIKDKPGAAVIVYRRDKTAGTTISEDPNMKNAWFKEHLVGAQTTLPFSFMYDGQPSAKLLAKWPVKEESKRIDEVRTQHVLTWTDPNTGLEVRCVAVDYADFPVVEWTVWIKNTGAKDTPILAEIQGIDTALDRPKSRDLILHYIEGDSTNPGYAPRQKELCPGTQLRFSPENGRPTSGSFPYYNVEGDHAGVIFVVGWSGQWACTLAADPKGSLHVKAGQELTRLKLHPGEEMRSPLIVMMFWQGSDWMEGQNLWRRWMRAHNMPRPGGKEVPLVRAACTSGLGPDYAYDLVNEKDQIAAMDRYFEEGIRLNYWWLDIYHGSTNAWCTDVAPYAVNGAFIQSKGLLLALDWNADPRRYPNGLRAVSDHARSKGAKLIAWYEPEHVWPGYKLYEHQDWLLSVPNDPRIKTKFNQGLPLGERRLLNLGHPAACQWAIDHFSHLVKKEGIAVYRQDFNLEPLVFWRHSDSPDRQGMTENLYVRGYLRFWQTLLERQPELLIDSCASGGRRNDLETLRLSVPLWRSDTAGPALALQCQTYGLALWIPYFGTGTPGIFGTGTPSVTVYDYRSSLGASLVSGYDVRKRNLNYELLRRLEGDFRLAAPFFLEDYYPLTPYSQAKDQWMAWQFNRSAQGDGVVQAFRREQSAGSSLVCRLRGVDSAATYEVTNFDVEGATKVSGKDLMDKGLTIEIKDKPGAAVIVYRRVQAPSPR